MSRCRGYALVELLVASACGGLAAAAALTLLAAGAGLAATAGERLAAADTARACADALGMVIAGGLEGLEGATAIVAEDRSPRVEISPGRLRAVVAASEPFEIEAMPDGAWRAAAAVRARPGDSIVLLPPDAPGGAAAGAVVSFVAGTDLRWESSSASQRLQLDAPPRAVAVVRSVELEWRRSEAGLTLHRRIDDGRWQPLGAEVSGVHVGWEPSPAGSPAARVRCDGGPAAPAAERVVRAP